MNEDWDVLGLQIPGYPMYRLIPENSRVLSFHKDKSGKLLTLARNDGFEGYYLWEDGERKFFTVKQLKTLIERHKLKKVREEMNYTSSAYGATSRNSVSGRVQTGDWIVGSLNKQTGEFSASKNPARHLSAASAKQEAARLAAIDKAKKYVVLKVEGQASVEEVVWS